MATDLLAETDSRMRKALDALKRDLVTVRTGRASSDLLDNIQVEYYGTSTLLNQLATITIPEARLITIQPLDRQALPEIEKAILKSELGLNPSSDGALIRIPVPPLSQERRQELVRLLHRKIEDGHISVRNIRRDEIEKVRTLEKSKELSQDESRRIQESIQKLTDAHINQMDILGKEKETAILEI